MKPSTHRREFLTALGVAASTSALGYPANETINIGCIGTGGRCRTLMRNLDKVPGTRITALADIWEDSLAEAQKLAAPNAFITRHYPELLERSDVDAVIIGSPDHWHVPMTIDACEAGKDVYVEKPLTHDLSEGEMVIRAQNDNKRIVQVGTQQRSMPQFHKAKEIIDSGKLGKIYKVHMTWNRNRVSSRAGSYDAKLTDEQWRQFLGRAPLQPFDSYRYRNWRWFWDFGGGMLTDLMVHWIDVVNWLLDLSDPAEATTIGDNFAMKEWETPDTIQTLFRYPDDGVQIYFEGTFVNARNKAMIEIMAENATLYLDRGRYEIFPEPGKGLEKEVWSPGTGERGADFDVNGEQPHLQNWVDAIRSRKKPNAPAEEGVRACVSAHMGNLAYRTGQVVRLENFQRGGLAD